MRNYWKIIAIVFLTAVGFSFLRGIYADQPQKNISDTTSYEKIYDAWSREIDLIGPEEAYQKFTSEYRAQNYGDQHAAAHIFGTLLFKKIGEKGITVCDNAFQFGCYHTFLSEIINEKGIKIIKKLDELCLEKESGGTVACQHGIGHGIIAHVGYDELQESLELCGTLANISTTGGCSSGVFMEYNFKTMSDPYGSGILARKINQANVWEPCDSVKTQYSESCFYNQAVWWVTVLNNDYPRIAKLCGELSNDTLRTSCYSGLGTSIASHSEYDPAVSVKECESLSTRESVASCLGSVAVSFSAIDNHTGRASKICARIENPFGKECLKKLINSSND